MIRKTAGSKLYIGDATTVPSTDVDASTFSAITYVEVGAIIDLGEVGDQSQEITLDLIDRQRLIRLKGTRDGGTMQIVVAADEGAEAGQEDMIEAEATAYDYAFKIELDDAPATGSDPTPTTIEFLGQVMSKRLSLGTANNVVQATYVVAVNTNQLLTAAATGD